jgi:hypothetical protein
MNNNFKIRVTKNQDAMRQSLSSMLHKRKISSSPPAVPKSKSPKPRLSSQERRDNQFENDMLANSQGSLKQQ